jgi:hypothetical protein
VQGFVLCHVERAKLGVLGVFGIFCVLHVSHISRASLTPCLCLLASSFDSVPLPACFVLLLAYFVLCGVGFRPVSFVLSLLLCLFVSFSTACFVLSFSTAGFVLSLLLVLLLSLLLRLIVSSCESSKTSNNSDLCIPPVKRSNECN